jgi:hypothetical protein
MEIERTRLLFDMILKEKTSSVDKSGNTPLFIRAIRYKNLPQTDDDKLEEIKTITELSRYFNEFDSTDYRNLLSYINIGMLYNTYLKEKFESYLLSLTSNRELQNKDEKAEAFKRIFLIELLQSIDEFSITESIIINQHLIKKYFWLNYAIFLSKVSIEKGTIILDEIFREQPNYAIIYQNREDWYKKFGRDSFIKNVLPLMQYLDKEEKEDFKEFCKANSILLTERDRNYIAAKKKFDFYILGKPKKGEKTTNSSAIPKNLAITVGAPYFDLKKHRFEQISSIQSRKRVKEKATN